MKRSRLFGLPLLLLTGISGLACTGTETGNPTKARVTFNLESSDDKQFSIGQAGAGVNIREARIGMKQLGFTACGEQAATQVAAAMMVDLRSGEAAFEVPAQQVCQIELALQSRNLGWAKIHPGSEAALSIGIAGLTAGGAPLFIEDSATPTVTFRPSRLEVKPGSELVFSLDVAKALSFDEIAQLTPDAQGEFVITGQLNGPILANIEQRWASSWSLYTVNDSGGLELVAPGEAQ